MASLWDVWTCKGCGQPRGGPPTLDEHGYPVCALCQVGATLGLPARLLAADQATNYAGARSAAIAAESVNKRIGLTAEQDAI